MHKFLTMVSVAALAGLGASMVAAQDATDADATSRTYDLAAFEGLSVVGPHHVVVSVGPTFSVRAQGPAQTLADTEVEVEDGRLKIHPIDDDRWDQRCRDRDGARDQGRDMRIDRVEGADFHASLAGSGGLDIASLRVDDAHFSIAGSGDMVARGSARHSRVSIAGAGNLEAREVTSADASVSIAGSGNVALTVQDDARVSIVGSGDVEIAGPARCSVSRFGGGKVRCNGENVAS